MERKTFTLKNPATGKTKILKNVYPWFAYQMRAEYYPGWIFAND